jgi:DNA-binding MarR family transcriptional regulator
VPVTVAALEAVEDRGNLHVTADPGTPASTSLTLDAHATASSDAASGTPPSLWGLVAGLAALAVAWLHEPTRYRLLGGPAALYTRLSREEVMENDTRRAIYEHVREHPGVHLSAIKRNLGLGNGTVAHHLRVLEDRGMLASHSDGRRKRFYPPDDPAMDEPCSPHEKVLAVVERHPGLTQTDVAEAIDASRQLVHYHVQNLENADRLRVEDAGATTRLFPNHEDT